jgi:site-specific DNA recombinase
MEARTKTPAHKPGGRPGGRGRIGGPTPAAKYRRISDDREGRELGIERQDEDLDELAQRRGYRFVASYVDNDIGASTRSKRPRPGFKQMLVDARTGQFKVICAYTSSRLTRRPREHEDLIDLAEQYGIRYDYVRSPSFDLNTAAGRRVARILAANDAGESEDISERVSRARRQQAEQGRFGGGARRYGHNFDGSIRENEAAVIREAAEKLLAGVGVRGIVRELNARQVPTARVTTGHEYLDKARQMGRPEKIAEAEARLERALRRGGKWSHAALRDLLLQPRIAGLMAFAGEIIVDAPPFWEPIIPRGQWEAVRALLDNPDRRTTPGPIPKHLLSHLAVCGHPQHAEDERPVMVKSWAGGYQLADGSRGPRIAAYRCSTSAHVACAQGPLEEYVEAVVIERLAQPDAAELLVPRAEVDMTALAEEATSLRARLQGLGDLVETGDMGPAEYRVRRQRLAEQLAKVEQRMVEANGSTPLAGLAGRDDVAKVWAGLDLGRKRAVIDCLMTIVVLPAVKRGKGFDPERVGIEWKQ